MTMPKGGLGDPGLLLGGQDDAKTFAKLPLQNVTLGAEEFITDCNTTSFYAAAAGGGSNPVKVFYAGKVLGWRVG
jgi:hypothetical protein